MLFSLLFTSTTNFYCKVKILKTLFCLILVSFIRRYDNYLSIDFFNRLFQAYDSAATPNQVLPNDLESTITNIKAMFGFWTEQFVSALGYGPGGGGGGDTLTEPLASINSASLGTPTAAGQVITWNGTNGELVKKDAEWHAVDIRHPARRWRWWHGHRDQHHSGHRTQRWHDYNQRYHRHQ